MNGGEKENDGTKEEARTARLAVVEAGDAKA